MSYPKYYVPTENGNHLVSYWILYGDGGPAKGYFKDGGKVIESEGDFDIKESLKRNYTVVKEVTTAELALII